MVIPDRLYKEVEISNPIIDQLINTKPFLRLKEINQYGGVNFVYPNKYQVTRYQHSLGVYHVLKTVDADLETQITGLLHDVGHVALSHMYDMALSTHAEDIHEQIMHNLDGWDEIQTILKANDLKLRKPDDYVLIKKSLPDIGADRFDYALRDYFFATNETSDLPIKLVGNLSKDENGMYFNSIDLAKKFAETGNKAMWYVIYEPSVAIIYQSLIEMIRIGFREKWLSYEDFMKTDKYIIDKMMQHKSTIPENYTKVFNQGFVVSDATIENYDFKFVKLKSRYFDPRVKVENKTRRISELDPNFREELEDYIALFEKAKSGIYYKINFI